MKTDLARIRKAIAPLTVTAALVGFFAVSSLAGRLSSDLLTKVSGMKSADLVQVWIKLPEVESAAAFKSDIRAKATTREERYRLTLDRLHQNHTSAQRDLLSHLKSVSRRRDAMPPRGHWLVNIIEAEVTVDELNALASRSDIETIYSVPEILSIAPDAVTMPALSTAEGVESNLEYINAPAAWTAGYTGEGRVICIFDTGVDGLHPALFNQWKGHDGDSAAAWFDPVDGETFPHHLVAHIKQGADYRHGTGTTGLALGHDDILGDTVGVALDAKWIAAGVVDIWGASIIDAFEWAANPDGDPNSLDDVPDVINHSWGVADIGCENIFYSLIDNTEALGIVNIFAAGNEGLQGTMTIRNPANRANDLLDCFAVGSIDHTTGIIASTSSRGPSDCTAGAFKPNVVAPGVAVRFPVPDGTYAFGNGTSFATPHVSGLVALLRQKNPNATVDEIKEAILTSTDHLQRSLPDNTYGWGLIDCMAALNALSDANAQPNVRVYSFDHSPVGPGDEIAGTLVLKNFGATVTGVSAVLQNNNAALTVAAGSASFGTIAEGDTVRTANEFRLIVSDTVTPGSVLPIDLVITGSGYSQTRKLYFIVQPSTSRSFVTHNTGRVEFTVTNFGTYGLADNSYFPAGGRGFIHLTSDNSLYDGGLMIGVFPDRVSDGVTTAVGEPDGDFAVAPGGNLTFVTPMSGVSQQTFSRFTDERSENPLGLTIEQHTYSFNYAPFDDFVILQYVIENSGSEMLSNLYVGVHNDWDVVNYAANVGSYEASGEFAWTGYNDGSQITAYRGVRVLHRRLVTAYTDTSSSISCPSFCYTNSAKFNALAKGVVSPNLFLSGFRDLFQVVAARTHLGPGDVDTIAFAYLASNTYAGIQDVADRAAEAYLDTILMGIPPGPPPLPSGFALLQNYPNPFNSGTTIEFVLENTTDYRLSIYNILGRKVREYVGRDGPGEIRVSLGSEGLASGIYLYRLEAGDEEASKKMVLIK